MPTLQSIALMAGVPTNGMTVYAYHASRFPLPATDAAVPDGLAADAGPFTSVNDPISGDGFWSGTVSDQEPYCFTALGSDGHTYWLGPVTPLVSTTQQPYSASVDQTANRTLALTSIAAASGGQVLPQGTINVSSTAGFRASGLCLILIGLVPTVVAYTGTTTTTFTGCTGGSGTLGVGQLIFQGFQAGSDRRKAAITAGCQGRAVSDLAIIRAYATRAGVIKSVGRAGILVASGIQQIYGFVQIDVDAFGYYGAYGQVGGSGPGAISLTEWEELDG